MPSHKKPRHPGEPVRVMHVINSLGPGGAERMLVGLVCDEDEREIEYLVVSLKSDLFHLPTLEKAGIKVELLNADSPWRALKSVWKLASIIRRFQPAVLKSWMYHANIFSLFALWLSGWRKQCALIWGIRCSNMRLSDYHWQLRVVILLSRLLDAFPDLLIANSIKGRKDHIAFGFRRSGFGVIPNGVDTDMFQRSRAGRARLRQELGIDENAFVIGVVARNDPMKNYPLLLDVMGRLQGVRCVAVGRGTEQLPATEGVMALGQRSDVPDLLRSFDAVVSCSSFGEGMSNSIAEAMSCGIPVIATDVGDSRHLVGDTGIVIQPEDGAALQAAIERLRDDPDLRETMGAHARLRMENEFSLRNCRKLFRRLFLSQTYESEPG